MFSAKINCYNFEFCLSSFAVTATTIPDSLVPVIAFLTGYVELKERITNDLFERITLALDILEMENPPELNEKCGDCNFFKKQSILKDKS